MPRGNKSFAARSIPFICAIGALAFIPIWPGVRAQETKPSDLPTRARQVPLESVQSTSYQEGLIRLSAAATFEGKDPKYVHDYGYDLAQIRRHSEGMGATNLALVRGNTIAQAIQSARWLYASIHNAEKPVWRHGREDLFHASVWLVFNLGATHSEPVAFLVDRVELQDYRITARFHRPKVSAATRDIHLYLYWVPLGELPKGLYTVELIDSGSNRTSIMRQIEVD